MFRISFVEKNCSEKVLILSVLLERFHYERPNGKKDKTKIALEHDIDIVLELPFMFATQSADKFSYASIKILNEFKIRNKELY